MIRAASRVFVIVAGMVAAGTFVFSLLSDFKRTNEADIRIWQKAIMFKIVADVAPEPAEFSDIKQKYVTEATANQQLDVPREELDDNVMRRILLELIADDALRLTDRGSYAINSIKDGSHQYKELIELFYHLANELSRKLDHYEALVEENQRLRNASLDAVWQAKVNDLQKAIIFEVVLKAAPNSIGFEEIQGAYVSRSAEYEERELPKDQLNPKATRRVLLELIADNAIIQTARDEYSLNNLQSLQAMRMLEMTEAAKNDRREFQANRLKFEQESERRTNITELILQMVGDKPGKYTEGELVRALMRTESLRKAEAVMAVNGALAQRLLFFHRKKGEKGGPRIYLGMDLPH